MGDSGSLFVERVGLVCCRHWEEKGCVTRFLVMGLPDDFPVLSVVYSLSVMLMSFCCQAIGFSWSSVDRMKIGSGITSEQGGVKFNLTEERIWMGNLTLSTLIVLIRRVSP